MSDTNGHDPTFDIFVSHAREDSKRVEFLAKALEMCGWSVWWDARINPGTVFDDAIEEHLDNARCVLVLWSRHSVKSTWVRAEAEAAMTRGVLVPASIDEVTVPLAFRRVQTADLVGFENRIRKAAFEPLERALSSICGKHNDVALQVSVLKVPPRIDVAEATEFLQLTQVAYELPEKSLPTEDGSAAIEMRGVVGANETKVFISEPVMDGMLAASRIRRDVSVAGVLAGQAYRCRDAAFIEIDAFTGFDLAKSDAVTVTIEMNAWSDLLTRHKSMYGPTKMVLGWYVSRLFDPVAPSREDELLHMHFFDKEWQVLTLVSPGSGALRIYQCHANRLKECGFFVVKDAV